MTRTDVPLESGRQARRSRCPDCRRIGVTVRDSSEGQALACRHCEWWAWWCNGGIGDYAQDRRELMRWEHENGRPGFWDFTSREGEDDAG